MLNFSKKGTNCTLSSLQRLEKHYLNIYFNLPIIITAIDFYWLILIQIVKYANKITINLNTIRTNKQSATTLAYFSSDTTLEIDLIKMEKNGLLSDQFKIKLS